MKYIPHHRPFAQGHIYLGDDKVGACTIELEGAASMPQRELDSYGKMFAAAPAMLAVLRDIVTYVSPGEDIPLARMLDEARAAVDSAEGR